MPPPSPLWLEPVSQRINPIVSDCRRWRWGVWEGTERSPEPPAEDEHGESRGARRGGVTGGTPYQPYRRGRNTSLPYLPYPFFATYVMFDPREPTLRFDETILEIYYFFYMSDHCCLAPCPQRSEVGSRSPTAMQRVGWATPSVGWGGGVVAGSTTAVCFTRWSGPRCCQPLGGGTIHRIK